MDSAAVGHDTRLMARRRRQVELPQTRGEVKILLAVVAVLVVAGIGWGTEGMIFAFFGLWGLVGVVYGLMLVLAVIAQIIEAWRRG